MQLNNDEKQQNVVCWHAAPVHMPLPPRPVRQLPTPGRRPTPPLICHRPPWPGTLEMQYFITALAHAVNFSLPQVMLQLQYVHAGNVTQLFKQNHVFWNCLPCSGRLSLFLCSRLMEVDRNGKFAVKVRFDTLGVYQNQ